jgi:hypothetical protein
MVGSGGLPSVIPFGEPADQITPLFASLIRFFCFHLFSHRQAWLVHLKTKTPWLHQGSNLFCGERGIRTPGPASRGTHAFQACQLNHSCISPSELRSLSEGGICQPAIKFGGANYKNIFRNPCYEISPAIDLFRHSITFSFE